MIFYSLGHNLLFTEVLSSSCPSVCGSHWAAGSGARPHSCSHSCPSAPAQQAPSPRSQTGPWLYRYSASYTSRDDPVGESRVLPHHALPAGWLRVNDLTERLTWNCSSSLVTSPWALASGVWQRSIHWCTWFMDSPGRSQHSALQWNMRPWEHISVLADVYLLNLWLISGQRLYFKH